MSKCKNCCKEFKYQWCLDRHLRRKIPCKKNIQELSENTTELTFNTTELTTDTTELTKKMNNTTEQTGDTTEPTNANNIEYTCKYCNKVCKRKFNLDKHLKTCKEKDDIVRGLEIMLNISYPNKTQHTECRFCNKLYQEKYILSRHIKTCKAKQEYRESLEAKLKENQKHQQSTVTNNINNNQTINVLNISAETLKKFGEENTDHITNAYLRQMMGRLGVTIPKVVSNVAKKIYCDDAKPENKTIQISNVRSQWAKVSNGNDYELQALGDSIKGVRNKVTNLYVERLCDDFEYFKKVNARIDRLDDLNNQNYTARTLEDKEDQKNASKLRSEIDRDIKSMIYNVQKTGNNVIKNQV